MAQEFKIGRLRYTWKGVWAEGVTYNRDAVAQYNGKTYICLEPHTAQANFYNDLEFVTLEGASTPRWLLAIDGRIWKTDWEPDTFYSLGNIVRYGGVVYICTEPHTSESAELTYENWATYSSYDNWSNEWSTSTVYGPGDIAKYGGIVYRCTVGHTSASTAELGLENDIDYEDDLNSKWEIVNNGVEYKGEWSDTDRYKTNDIVRSGADLYICTEGHTSVIPFDYEVDNASNSKWALFQPGVTFNNTWNISTIYQVGDIVMYGGYSYRSLVANNEGELPSASLENDPSAKWEIVTTGFNHRKTWDGTLEYRIGDVVNRGGHLYTAIADSFGEDPSTFGLQTSYVADGSSDTTIIVDSTAGIVKGMIVTGTSFTSGQTVVSVVDSTTIILNKAPSASVSDGDLINFVGVNYTYWMLIVLGKSWKRFWTPGETYTYGEVVIYGNNTYKCIQTSFAEITESPASGILSEYWIVDTPHDKNNAGTQLGDIVVNTSNGNSVLSLGDDDLILTATTTDTNEKTINWGTIGSTNDVYYVAETGLDIEDNGKTVENPWKSIKYACEQVEKGFYNQEANQILLANKEYIVNEMYAWMLTQVSNEVSPYTADSIFDETSTKRDARLVIDALSYDLTKGGNSRTVRAALSYFKTTNNSSLFNAATTDAKDYIYTSLSFVSNILANILSNVDNETTYQLDLVTYNDAISYLQDDIVYYDSAWYQAVSDVTGQTPGTGPTWSLITDPGLVKYQNFENGFTAETESIDIATSLLDIIITAIQTSDKTTIPQQYGSATATIFVKTGTYFEQLPIIVPDNVAVNGDELRGATIFPARSLTTYAYQSESNTNQITLATTARIELGDPIQFNAESVNDDFGGISEATTYYIIDIDGNKIKISNIEGGSETVLENGTGFMNVFAGDCLRDMFYMRNASGLRNCSLRGLAGFLTSANEFGTQRPSGGSYVSLDPGINADDTSAWIKERSPYIQNVTNFGVGCTGMKIDGYLHNGGNKSMVANDFTQIISDGIGVYCKGPGALTECVSVFSYYNYSGYFAEDGGRIRATNGNSSYGTYGVIAEGFDPTETPISGNVDNQSLQVQAAVQSAFGVDAELISLGYTNAGSNYFETSTNLLTYSNKFDEDVWVTDGNVTLQQNNLSPFDNPNAWTATGLTSSTDSSYFYQTISIPVAGNTYTSLSALNVTGSGVDATFNIAVTGTIYTATVNNGGSGYVVGNVVRILGSELGGIDGVNDCFIEVTGLAGSSVTSVTVTGVVPDGSAKPYTFSVYVKQGTSQTVAIELTWSGVSNSSSGVEYNFETKNVTPYNGSVGALPVVYKALELTSGWVRLSFLAYDYTALNNNLEARIYPRGKFGFSGYTRVFGTQIQRTLTPTFYLDTLNTRYTANADIHVEGAGTGAVLLANETRSKSVYEARLTDTAVGTGGKGYNTASNNAQAGDDISITLAGSETGTALDFNTMRVFIQSGTGAGQYGYIANYNEPNFTASVLKESFTPLNIITSDSSTNELSTSGDIYNLQVDSPVQFTPTYYSTTVSKSSTTELEILETIGGAVNQFVVASTSLLQVNTQIQFTGDSYGGVINNFVYYIKEVIDDTHFSISTTIFGNAVLLQDGNFAADGNMVGLVPEAHSKLAGSTSDMIVNMPITFTGASIGGIVNGDTYYVNDVINDNEFTLSTALININVTGAADTTNYITADTTSQLSPLNPIMFSGVSFGSIGVQSKYYVKKVVNATTFTVTDGLLELLATATESVTNLITVTDTSGLTPNDPVVFRGKSFGGISNDTIYYVLAVNDGTTFTISLSPGGSAVVLSDATGNTTMFAPLADSILTTETGTLEATTTNNRLVLTYGVGTMKGTYRTQLFGNIVYGNTYYIKEITQELPLDNKFTISETVGGSEYVLRSGQGTMNLGELGWDHINPGTLIETALDNSTVYYVEPRITFTSPSTSQLFTSLPAISPDTSWKKIAYGDNLWMAIPTTNAIAAKTENGSTWESVILPVSRAWTDIAYGNEYWVIISNDEIEEQTGSTVLVSASHGNGWRLYELPSKTTWSHISYGNGVFVALAESTNTTAYSLDYGQTWSASSGITGDPVWTSVAYGGGKFIAVSETTIAHSVDGQTWTTVSVPVASSWSSVTYGNGVYVIVSLDDTTSLYSTDGSTWTEGISSLTSCSNVVYGQGVFIATPALTYDTAYLSDDGNVWRKQTVEDNGYTSIAFGYIAESNNGVFVSIAPADTENDILGGSVISAGTTTKGRVTVTSGAIEQISLFEPGSNYNEVPSVTIIDPSTTFEAAVIPRKSNGVLANPTFINKGQNYNTTSTAIQINGSGFADTFQTGLGLIVKNLSQLPGPGDNLTIAGVDNVFKITSATAVFGSEAPNIIANLTVSPDITVALSPAHDAELEIRTKYSQARLSGHDYLNVGFGTKLESNYPYLPEDTVLSPQDQAVEVNYGRVFYVSTDQDGNFKVGDLFGVEQATGIVTLSASQFGLEGLDSLALGGISVGGSSVTIRQFSTEQTFVANSNELIPTQRAIKAYLEGRLSQGGSNTFTGQTVAGTVLIGGPNKIRSTIPNGTNGSVVNMPGDVNFTGQYAAWDGDGAALALFFNAI